MKRKRSEIWKNNKEKNKHKGHALLLNELSSEQENNLLLKSKIADLLSALHAKDCDYTSFNRFQLKVNKKGNSFYCTIPFNWAVDNNIVVDNYLDVWINK